MKYKVIDYDLPIIQGKYLTQIGESTKSDKRGVWLKFDDGEVVFFDKYMVMEVRTREEIDQDIKELDEVFGV